MIDSRNKCLIINEFSQADILFYFDNKEKKFLHNIDTFYYSVKFKNDFCSDTKDKDVITFRKFFQERYKNMTNYDSDEFYLSDLKKYLVLKRVSFSKFYNICLSYPDYFDIFFAPVVPKAADDGDSVTCECIVQIRSYMLWQFSAVDCFENSYEFIKSIANYFHLEIAYVQENRVDYCWHTNYLSNPEQFFNPDNFYKMRVDRFKNATYVTNKVGSEDYEIDYVSLGKRSDKVFVRIYQKTREVIEQNYKGWFLKIWLMNGLINNYDFYVYEKAYQKRSWFYRFYARLEFYREFGSDEYYVKLCEDIISGNVTIEENELIKLADKLTPKLNYIVNVEFQTMRRHSKSYCLIPFKDYNYKGETKRIYEYFSNRKLITDYLTNKTLRLVEYDPNVKKSEREMCSFWKGLRRTKCIDVKLTSDNAKLVRQYNRKLSEEAMTKRFINSAVTLSLYMHGENSISPVQDAFDSILKLNDNDIHNAAKYKTKKLRQLNRDELALIKKKNYHTAELQFLDCKTGALYDYSNILSLKNQGDTDEPGTTT